MSGNIAWSSSVSQHRHTTPFGWCNCRCTCKLKKCQRYNSSIIKQLSTLAAIEETVKTGWRLKTMAVGVECWNLWLNNHNKPFEYGVVMGRCFVLGTKKIWSGTSRSESWLGKLSSEGVLFLGVLTYGTSRLCPSDPRATWCIYVKSTKGSEYNIAAYPSHI
jgi:hypothetical protein